MTRIWKHFIFLKSAALNLQGKLVLLMVMLLTLTLGAAVAVSLFTQRAIVQATEDNVRALAGAIQISVRELTAVGRVDRDLLKRYVEEHTRAHFTVSIASTEDKIINSSDPRLIGTSLHGPGGRAAATEAGRNLEVVHSYRWDPTVSEVLDLYQIPVEIEDHLMGYISVAVKFGDLTRALRENQLHLVELASLIFILGIIIAYFMAGRYVRPIHAIAETARNVSARGLEPVPEVQRRDEIGLLTRSFNEMVVQLRRAHDREQELNRLERFTALGQLAGRLAHEIKNPLNFISLAVDQLRSRYAPNSSAERQEFLQQIATIKDEVRRMSAMVQNFLQYGKPIAINRTTTDLRQLVEDVLALTQPRFKSQGIEVVMSGTDTDTIMNVDAEKLRTCVLNVVTNAAAAMPEGGKLEITFARRDNFLEIVFRDSGIGLSPESAARAFEPFFTTKSDGIGLGLFFSRAIIERHGGTISLEPNDPPPGAHVIFRLPLETSDGGQ